MVWTVPLKLTVTHNSFDPQPGSGPLSLCFLWNYIERPFRNHVLCVTVRSHKVFNCERLGNTVVGLCAKFQSNVIILTFDLMGSGLCKILLTAGKHWVGKFYFPCSEFPCSAPSHYLNQCWLIVNRTFGKKYQWNLKQSSRIFIQKITLKCRLTNILSRPLGLYSLSGKTSYRKISWSIEAARLDVAMVVSLWNLTGTSAAALPRYLPNFRAIGKV